MKSSLLCRAVHGGTCTHLVSKKNNYICAANHGVGLTASLSQSEHGKKTGPGDRLSDKTFRERYEIASFSTLTMVEQYRLLEDANSVVASAMAKNPILLDDLQELALTKETAVRGSLASNPSISERIIGALSNDNDIFVRRALAKNPSLPKEYQLEFLENNQDSIGRRALAENPSLCVEAAKVLCNAHVMPIGLVASKDLPTIYQAKDSLLESESLLASKLLIEYCFDHPKMKNDIYFRSILIDSLAHFKVNGGSKSEIDSYLKEISYHYKDDEEMIYLCRSFTN